MHPAVTLSMIILSLMELGFARNSTFGCIERERNALLRFRASLEDPSSRFSSWNHKNQDCCSWQGVGCNKITRHVISLDLSTKIDADASYGDMLQGTTLDSSLLELKYLSYLDLSWNYFQSSKIPPFLGSMEQLQHLNLSNCFFHGLVPHHLGNLSSLRVLDLNYNDLVVDDLRWATNLSSLEYLDMSCVNLSSIKDAFEIPIGNQLQTLTDPSIYGGNPQLCGAPLPKKCRIDGAAKAPEKQGAGDEDKDDKAGFYAVVDAGFATGVLGLIGVLVAKVKWRRAYFGFVEAVADKILGYQTSKKDW